MNFLTDEEFEHLHAIVYDECYYGDDDIVYGDGPEAILTREVMAKLDAEKVRRASQ